MRGKSSDLVLEESREIKLNDAEKKKRTYLFASLNREVYWADKFLHFINFKKIRFLVPMLLQLKLWKRKTSFETEANSSASVINYNNGLKLLNLAPNSVISIQSNN